MLKINYNGVELQVADQDFSNEMNWGEAIGACSELGSDWRLPTIEELKAIYEQLISKAQGNFNEYTVYWSITEYDANHAWRFQTYSSDADYALKSNSGYVRAVRDL